MWLSNSNIKTNNVRKTQIEKKKIQTNLQVSKNSLEKYQELCLKCNNNVSAFRCAKERHIFRHIQYEINCKDFFKCLLCPTNDNYEYVTSQDMAHHIRRVHCVTVNSIRKYYLDNRNKYFDAIQSMAIACFGKKFYKKRLYKTRRGTGTDCFTKIVSTVKVSNEKYQKKLLKEMMKTEVNIDQPGGE